MPEGFWRSIPVTNVRPSGCGAFWTNLARWPRRFGTIIPRSWRRLAGGWPASFASASWTLISAVRSRRLRKRPTAGRICCVIPTAWCQIVAAVAKACAPTPVTAKIRLGACRDTINACDVAQAVEDAGGAALTVHGRTAADMFRGSADWEEISRIKPYLYRIPLIGNGDIATPQAVVEAFRRYDIDGVMIGRAALHRPWLFRQAQAALRGEPIPPDPGLAQQRAVMLEHYRLVTQRFGQQQGTVLMRKYACCYANGRPGAAPFAPMWGKPPVRRNSTRSQSVISHGRRRRGAKSRELGSECRVRSSAVPTHRESLDK